MRHLQDCAHPSNACPHTRNETLGQRFESARRFSFCLYLSRVRGKSEASDEGPRQRDRQRNLWLRIPFPTDLSICQRRERGWCEGDGRYSKIVSDELGPAFVLPHGSRSWESTGSATAYGPFLHIRYKMLYAGASD